MSIKLEKVHLKMLNDSVLKEGNVSRSLCLSYFISEYNAEGS